MPYKEILLVVLGVFLGFIILTMPERLVMVNGSEEQGYFVDYKKVVYKLVEVKKEN